MAIAISCCAPSAAAQAARSVRNFNVALGGDVVFAQMHGDDFVTVYDADPIPMKIANPIRYPGDYFFDLQAGVFVLVGLDSARAGSIVVLQRGDDSVYRMTNSKTLGNRDFVGIAYSYGQKKLFALDATSKQVVSADYALGAAAPSSWKVSATAVHCPVLTRAAGFVLSVVEDKDAEVVLSLTDSTNAARDEYYIHLTAATPTQSYHPGLAERRVALREGPLAPAATSIELLGPAGKKVEVLRVDLALPSVIGAAQMDREGHGVAATRPFVLGEIYTARGESSTSIEGPYLTPQLTWGSPAVIDEKIAFIPSQNIGLLHHVDSVHFRMPLFLSLNPSNMPALPSTRRASLVMGVEGMNSIVDGANGKILVSSTSFDTDALLWSKEAPGIASIRLPLPNDPNLAGLVYLYQWWIEVQPNVWRQSEVTGLLVRGGRFVPPGNEEVFGLSVDDALQQRLRDDSQVHDRKLALECYARWLAYEVAQQRPERSYRQLSELDLRMRDSSR